MYEQRRQDSREERRTARSTGEPRVRPTRYRMRQKVVAFGDDFDIEDAAGQKGIPYLQVQGSVLDHEHNIGEGPNLVAEVSKKWFRVRDTNGVSIKPGQNDVLILAVTVAVDMMAHPGR